MKNHNERLIVVKYITCNRNCNKCRSLNAKTDDKGYPWGYDCLKYGDSVFQEDFESTKEFPVYEKNK